MSLKRKKKTLVSGKRELRERIRAPGKDRDEVGEIFKSGGRRIIASK